MDRSQKEGFVSEIVDRINRAPTVYLTDFSGLNVTSMTELRRSLRAAGAEYVVVKNRLAKRAFAETDLPDITESLEGPTGMVFSYEDAVGAAKALSDFAKANDEKPSFKLGIMDNKVLQPEQVEAIAKLPSREVLLSRPRCPCWRRRWKASFKRWPALSTLSRQSANRLDKPASRACSRDAGASLVTNRVNPISGKKPVETPGVRKHGDESRRAARYHWKHDRSRALGVR